ncbi:hypothetical protein FQA39_LY03774 [Lamprigera yunnana]|nr:hypothetical protein FQA39_LY03774 [Lamprigera yunnana]
MFKFVVIAVCCITATKQQHPQLEIDQGVIKGSYRKTLNGRSYSSFIGIPYAKPPIGELRFKAPLPAQRWSGVLDATKEEHPVCPQFNIYINDFNIVGNEDCLFLNVYTPATKSSETRLFPVMFYIHGGGWMTGSANLYKPNFLLDQDVVLVTCNYRLGALGFLSTGDNVLPGNNALKDQNLALQWVNKNIAHFNGDPKSVTVFGQSAGAASAHFHMLSSRSKNLVHRVIIQSGSAIAKWALASKPLAANTTQKLAKLLNCPYESSQNLIKCLREVPAEDMVAQDIKLHEWWYHPMIPFRPVVEEESDDAFLTDDPINIINTNSALRIPLMIGFTTEEGALAAPFLLNSSQLLKDVNEDFIRVAPYLLMYHNDVVDQDEVSNKIYNLYFGGKKINRETINSFIKMLTDVWIHMAVEETVRLHTKYTEETVYYYLFGYRGTHSFTSLINNKTDDYNYGVSHSDELIYLLNFLSNNEHSSSDLKMIDIMTTLWTNFAKTNNPTPNEDKVIPLAWKPVSYNKFDSYFIQDPLTIQMVDVSSQSLKAFKEILYTAERLNLKEEL